MSEEKQIEEIAIMFVNFCEDELGADISLEIGEDFAEKLIAEGWRKKSEAAREIFAEIWDGIGKISLAELAKTPTLSFIEISMFLKSIEKRSTEKEEMKKDCRNCKHFIWCDPYEVLFYQTSGESCDEFEEGRTMTDIEKKAKRIVYDLGKAIELWKVKHDGHLPVILMPAAVIALVALGAAGVVDVEDNRGVILGCFIDVVGGDRVYLAEETSISGVTV